VAEAVEGWKQRADEASNLPAQDITDQGPKAQEEEKFRHRIRRIAVSVRSSTLSDDVRI